MDLLFLNGQPLLYVHVFLQLTGVECPNAPKTCDGLILPHLGSCVRMNLKCSYYGVDKMSSMSLGVNVYAELSNS